jgi:hypothetical protein
MVDQPLASRAGRNLRIYVAAHCAGEMVARALAERIGAMRPNWLVEVIDVDTAPGPHPAQVVATPMYMVGDRTLFWGNPAQSDLLAMLDRLAS